MRFLTSFLLCSFLFVSCSDDEKVKPDPKCENITCERGMCVEGECKNPESCETENDCLKDYACAEDSCVEIVDQCLDVVCEKGECSKETGECVNKSVCVRSNKSDCVDGFACYDQTCQDESTICAEIKCERGVCDYQSQDCVHKETCENDIECLSGFFCNEEKKCEENKCIQEMKECARGVCDERSATCVDRTICHEEKDCVDAKYCMGTQCVSIQEACKDCEGNQVCNYRGTSVVCEEASHCFNSLDCLGARVCEGGVCGSARECIADLNEGNNDPMTPTIWKDVATSGVISASLCQSDVDYYLYNTRDAKLFKGTLIVTLNIKSENVGNGKLKVELIRNDAVVAMVDSEDKTQVELRYVITAVNVGEFLVKVSDTSLNLAGMEYEIFIDLVDSEADEVCQNATPIVMGSATGNTALSQSTTLKPSCSDGVKRESVFKLDLQTRSQVTIALSQIDGLISVRKSCTNDESELECSKIANSLKTDLDAGTYFIVIESIKDDGPFGVAVSQKPIICNPGANRCMGADGGERCNAEGTGYDTFNCMGEGCDLATGFCVRPKGDLCSEPINATQGFNGSIDLSLFGGDYQSSTCSTSSATAGIDHVFKVDLLPHTRLDVRVRQNGFSSLGVMIVGNCLDIDQTCLAEDSGPRLDATYTNQTMQTESVFVVIDSESTFRGSVDVEISTTLLVCVPSSEICSGNDLVICDDKGSGSTLGNCPSGCDATTNTCNAASNNLCSTAIDVSAGGTFIGKLEDYTNNYAPGSCTRFGAPGSDAVWSITASAGQILKASLTGNFDSSLYVVTDCADPTSCVVGSDKLRVETIEYAIPADGTYFIITDAFSASATGSFALHVELITPLCAPGSTLCRGAAGIDTCRADGSGYDVGTCPGACDPATNECVGNTCSSPIPINASGQYMGDTSMFRRTYNPGASGCTHHKADGKDMVYAITGTPGEVVSATMTSGFDASLYALTDCSDVGSCLDGQDNGNPEEITFVIPPSGYAFIVADGYSVNASGAFTLDIDIRTPECFAPGQAIQCLDAMTLQYCDGLGFLKNYSCTCANSACTQPKSDICADMIMVTDQSTVSGKFSDFQDDYNPGSNACPHRSGDYDGPEAVYAVDLPAFSILSVDLQTSLSSAVIYITSDCEDVKQSCEWGASESNVEFFSEKGGRYYVHFDSTNKVASNNFSATFGIRSGACQPGVKRCYPQSSQTVVCSDDGSQVENIINCIAGCANDNACAGPVIPNDTCMSAYHLSASVSFVEDLSRFTNALNPGSGSCFAHDTPGEDLVYSVNLPANTVVDVKVFGTNSDRHTVAVVSDCNTPGTTCLAQGSEFKKTQVVYTSANSPQNVFIIVDHASNPKDELNVDIDIRPQECALNMKSCLGANQRQFCDSYYRLITETCTFGCTAGDCNPPTNDLCSGAVDATNGGTFSQDVAEYANDYNQNDNTTSSCTTYSTAGPDGVWSVNALAGQILDVALTGSGYDAALYISTDCSILVNSCVEGSDSGVSAVETIQYTIPSDGTYFIVADAYTSSAQGTFELVVSLTTP